MENTPEELIRNLNKAYSMLYHTIEELPELADKKCNAEHDYNIAVAKETLKQKTDGIPITLIPKLVAGNKVVAEYKLKYDLATEMYKIHYAKVKSYETAINKIQSILAMRRIEYQKASITE